MSSEELDALYGRLTDGKEPFMPSFDGGVLIGVGAALELNSPALGLAVLIRRLSETKMGQALLADSLHTEPVRAAERLLKVVDSDPAMAKGRARFVLRMGEEGGRDAGGDRVAAFLRTLLDAECVLNSGGVRCQQVSGSPAATTEQVVASEALLRFMDRLAAGDAPPALPGDRLPALPASPTVMAQAVAEVCNFDAMRRVARYAPAFPGGGGGRRRRRRGANAWTACGFPHAPGARGPQAAAGGQRPLCRHGGLLCGAEDAAWLGTGSGQAAGSRGGGMREHGV